MRLGAVHRIMKIPASVLDLLSVVAPTLATAFGTPLAGAAAVLAVRGLREYFGDSPGAGLVAPPPTPEAVVQAIAKNKNDPALLVKLQEVEADLKKFEDERGFRFAELEAKDRQNSRNFQTKSGVADTVLSLGRHVIWLGYAAPLTLILFAVSFSFGLIKLPYENREFITVVFSMLSSVVSGFMAWSGMVLAFYFGSSQSSQQKTDSITSQLAKQSDQLGKAAVAADKTAAASRPLPKPGEVTPPVAKPTADWKQGPFGGIRWQVMPDGVLIEGETAVARSPGQPATIRRIWAEYGTMIEGACQQLSVPVEIVVMTIATESAGRPKAKLVEPDKRMSLGLMQILMGTAAEVLGHPITSEALQDPLTNILAGTAYIHKQKNKTWFDPILTAAAYNAGGLYEMRPGKDDNRFHLRSTGDHLERAIRWYGDVCFCAKEDKWFG
jgi:soluble lytic murein transglycosylase-like protein